MSTPPPPPDRPDPDPPNPYAAGPPGPYRQHPAGAPGPYEPAPTAPPGKGGIPVWGWVLGGVLGLLLLCCCGLFGVGAYLYQSGNLPTAPQPTQSATVPDPPPGSVPNTDTNVTLPADRVEQQAAKGLSGHGYTPEDISCPEDLVLVAGRTTTCTAPAPGGGGTSDVQVVVDWAVVTSSNQVDFYLTFTPQEG